MSPRSVATLAATLVELLVCTAILMMLLGLLFTITSQTSALWKNTSSKIAAYQDSRAAFDALTRNLSQAVLNSYYDYYDAAWNRRSVGAVNFAPCNYGRFSELEYVSGPVEKLFGDAGTKQSHAVFFQSPLGYVENKTDYSQSRGLVNALGYYVEYGDNSALEKRPKFLRGVRSVDHSSFRLIEWMQPAEKLSLYDVTRNASDTRSWFKNSIAANDGTRLMAEDVVALVVAPKENSEDTDLAPRYFYDTNPAGDEDSSSNYDPERSHLLPPMIKVTLVALDRESAGRIQAGQLRTLLPSDLFQEAIAYDSDLTSLDQAFHGGAGFGQLNYRVFTTTVQLR